MIRAADSRHSDSVRRCVEGALAIVMTAVAVGAAKGEVRPDGEWRYHYFEQPRSLQLHEMRLAVRSEGAHASDTQEALRQAGVGVAAVARHAVPEWSVIELGEQRDGQQSMMEIINQAIAADDSIFVSPVFVDRFGGPLLVKQDVLVRFRSDVAPADAEAMLAARGLTILDADWAGMTDAYRVRSDSQSGFDVLATANELAQHEATIFAEPDVIFTGRGGVGPPNDTYFNSMWGLHNIGQTVACPDAGAGVAGIDVGALDAWTVTQGDPSVVIAVIDVGVQMNHPDLPLDPLFGADFTGQNGAGWPVNQCDNHGTPVAGCIGAQINNALGGVGVSPKARVTSARAFISNVNNPCDNSWTSAASWTVNAIEWAQNTIGASITNNSNSYGFQSSAIAAKYAEARDAGLVHFASAGNNESPQISYPASLSSVNAVAAIDQDGTLASFSNWGEGLAFSAPGRFIITTDRTGFSGYAAGDYVCFGGTSAAAPHAAGVAALIQSRCGGISPDSLEQFMRDGAMDLGTAGYDTIFGWGLASASGSLALIEETPSDLNCDGVVDGSDLLALLQSWGECGAGACSADLDGDNAVDGQDLLLLLAAWG